MAYKDLVDGLYLLRQHSDSKSVDHYGILDVGNRAGRPYAPQPVVVHQTPPSIRADWLQDTGCWTVLGKIEDEAAALARMHAAMATPEYNVLGHNCEHFARYVAFGKPESTQLHGVVVVAGLVGLVLILGTKRAA